MPTRVYAQAEAGQRPLELLQVAGIDLSSPAPIRAAVAYVGSLVDELEGAFAA
jgi:oligoendopeptidase F